MNAPNARASEGTVVDRTVRPSSKCVLDSRSDDRDARGLRRKVRKEGGGVRLSDDDGAAEEVKVQGPIGRRGRNQGGARGSVDQD